MQKYYYGPPWHEQRSLPRRTLLQARMQFRQLTMHNLPNTDIMRMRIGNICISWDLCGCIRWYPRELDVPRQFGHVRCEWFIEGANTGLPLVRQ